MATIRTGPVDDRFWWDPPVIATPTGVIDVSEEQEFDLDNRVCVNGDEISSRPVSVKAGSWLNAIFTELEATGKAYKVELLDSEYVLDVPLSFPQRGLEFSGQGGSDNQTRLVYDGTDNVAIKVLSRETFLKGFRLELKPGRSVVAGIYWDKPPSFSGTALSMEDVTIEGERGTLNQGTIDYCFMIGDSDDSLGNGASNNFNLEFGEFQRCDFAYAEIACFYLNNTTAQSKRHVFDGCGFRGKGVTGEALSTPAGMRLRTGSFNTRSCGFKRCQTAVELGSPTDTILIQDTDLESCSRLLDTAWFGQGGQSYFGVQIQGGRLSLDYFEEALDTANPYWIRFTYNGPLILQGVAMNQRSSTLRYDEFKIYTGGTDSTLISIGNVYPNLDPFTGDRTRIYSYGDRGRDLLTGSGARVEIRQRTAEVLGTAPPTEMVKVDGQVEVRPFSLNMRQWLDTIMSRLDSKGGGTLEFLTGTYTINASVVCPSNVHIKGQGKDKTTLVRNTAGSAFFSWLGKSNIKISDLAVDMDCEEAGVSFPAGFAFQNDQITGDPSTDIVVENVKFFSSTPVQAISASDFQTVMGILARGAKRLRILNCDLYDTQLKLSGPQGTGFGGVEDLWVENCRSENANEFFVSIVSVADDEPLININVVNNVIINPRIGGIYVGPDGDSALAGEYRNVLISGNKVFYDDSATDRQSGIFVRSGNNAKNFIIKDNIVSEQTIVSNSSTFGIIVDVIDAQNTPVENILIENNQVSMGDQGSIVSSCAFNGLVIRGNQITNGRGITATITGADSSMLSISGNQLSNITRIYLNCRNSNLSKGVISNNQMNNNIEGLRVDSTSPGVVDLRVFDNDFSGELIFENGTGTFTIESRDNV